MALTVRTVTAEEARAVAGGLAEVLIDCVEGGASVGFMSPMARATADAFWDKVIAGVAAGERLLLVAEDGGTVLGTAQIVFASPENQPHRADLSKLLVHRSARGRGVGALLLEAAEAAALAAGRTVLVLDTATPEAERLYERGGWSRLGAIPDYALMPDGALCEAVFFYKRLG